MITLREKQTVFPSDFSVDGLQNSVELISVFHARLHWKINVDEYYPSGDYISEQTSTSKKTPYGQKSVSISLFVFCFEHTRLWIVMRLIICDTWMLMPQILITTQYHKFVLVWNSVTVIRLNRRLQKRTFSPSKIRRFFRQLLFWGDYTMKAKPSLFSVWRRQTELRRWRFFYPSRPDSTQTEKIRQIWRKNPSVSPSI